MSLAWRDDQERMQSIALPFAFGPGRGSQPTLGLDADPNLNGDEWVAVLDWLAEQQLVMHGLGFDCLMMWAGTDTYEGADLTAAVAWDTMLASRNLDPGMGADLEMVERRIGPTGFLSNKERSAWLKAKGQRKDLNNLPWDEAAAYARTDAEVTLAACEHQQLRLEQGEGSRAAIREEVEYARVLARVEQRGIGYDVAESRRVARELAARSANIRKGLPFRATLPGAKRYYFTILGLEPETYTESGAPRLDEQEIARLESKGAPHAAEFALMRKIDDARSKWYESYAQHTGWDGRLRTRFSQAKVVSGRLSSTRVNLQAIPHDYQLERIIEGGWPTPRQLFKARKGTRLWELDLSQAELRVAAVEAECEPMLQLIREGADIHGAVTQLVLNDEPGSPTWTVSRQVGKRADFSFIFGVGAEEFQASLVKYAGIYLELAECNRIVQRWRRQYPEYGRTIRRYMANANHHGWVRLVNGRVRHFGSWEEKHKALNQYVQGSLAEFMRMWLVEYESQRPGRVLLTIHDSLVLETGDLQDVQACATLAEEMGTALFKVPMVVDVKEWGD